ncbi:Eco57I restriction-modification methylase [Paenibacillus sophorae]|uniref:DEAD/DEAH box helicase family protein n=1 Tax=Paenibacillus sophorae TaxID=1333845 RepID=A0A1H8H036_9BACL|nr:helicase-related protein [Paenibacillus sophorae]QWU14396.1 DEAD/DEAH box helicase family protein [Paenibacillus sophorae]SEN49495.1 Eco57I restriction-modification methylase [Paenibacillus sophorae]
MYELNNVIIPQNKRKEINEKVLYLIDNNLTEKHGISKNHVFLCYSGDGGLHGLSFSDYANFHEFSSAKREIENGQFYTPYELTRFLSLMLKPSIHDIIGDFTAGHGAFLNWLPCHENVYTNEIDIKSFKVQKFLYPKVNATLGDIREYTPLTRFDLICGNPPYNIEGFKWDNKKVTSQMYYCLKSAELLKPSSLFCIIVPDTFLADEFSNKIDIEMINDKFNFLLQLNLPSDVFKNVGVNNFKTKILFFQRKSGHLTDIPYSNKGILISEFSAEIADKYHTQYIAPVMQQKETLKAKLFYEIAAANSNTKEEQDFQFKVNKLLFDIKRNQKTCIHYAKCSEMLHRYKIQVKPEGMSAEEWSNAKLTPNMIISKLKKILKNQHRVEHDCIKLVKKSNSLKLKGYSHKNKIYLSKFTGVKEVSFNDMILKGEYPFEDQTYRKLLNKKIKAHTQQSKPFKEIGQNEYISDWLEAFTLYNKNSKQFIKLKNFQKEDIQKILQKDRALLAWNVGLGKTEAGITWMKYFIENNSIRNTFIVSSSISIKMTWTDRLESYDLPYKKIETLSDIHNIQPDDIVLISFNMLVKYQKNIKKYIKMQGRKIAFILDESHRCIYPNTKTTKATINVFQKVPYKLLMSGTPTKNTANELYSQFMILYGSSINCICECETVLSEDKKTGEWKEEHNKYYKHPFPAYKQSVFSSCFSPKKTSVFGIQKGNQDIMNSSKLVKLIEKTIIVRSMFDVMTKDVVEFKTHRISQNDNEQEVYRLIMEEFHSIVRGYYGTSGNYRRDAMLRIIQQIQLLQKAVSIPHKLKEYDGKVEPNKYKKIVKIINSANSDKVAIGTTFIDSATYYYNKLRTEFKERPIFLILGETPFKKRQEIIKEFEATENGLLISTQMSLSESVNIPSCDVVICEGLQYNIANMMQYIGRFTRLNSKNKTMIHFVTYLNTLEQNILALLMSKQRINEFVKQCEYKEDAEIFGEFGISLDIFSSIITKEYDENGSVRLTWGEQNIS